MCLNIGKKLTCAGKVHPTQLCLAYPHKPSLLHIAYNSHLSFSCCASDPCCASTLRLAV